MQNRGEPPICQPRGPFMPTARRNPPVSSDDSQAPGHQCGPLFGHNWGFLSAGIPSLPANPKYSPILSL